MKGTPYQYRYQSRVRKTNNGEAPRLWWELRKWSPATCTQAANIRCLMELVWTPHGSFVHTKPPAGTTLQKWDPSVYRGPHLAPTSAWWRLYQGSGAVTGQLPAVELPAATPHRQWAVLVICSQVPPFMFVQRNKGTGTDKSQEHWDEHKEKNIKILPRSIIQIVPQLFSLASSTYINKCVSTGVLCLKKKKISIIPMVLHPAFFFLKIDWLIDFWLCWVFIAGQAFP